MCWTGRQALCTDLEVAPREGAHPSRFLGLVGNEGCGEMGWGEREGKGEKDGQGRAGQVKPVTLLARQRLFRMDTLTPVTGGMGGEDDSHWGAWDGMPSAFCGSSFSLIAKGLPEGSVPAAEAAVAAVDTTTAAGVGPLCSSLEARKLFPQTAGISVTCLRFSG